MSTAPQPTQKPNWWKATAIVALVLICFMCCCNRDTVRRPFLRLIGSAIQVFLLFSPIVGEDEPGAGPVTPLPAPPPDDSLSYRALDSGQLQHSQGW